MTQIDPGSNVTAHLYDEGGALKTVKLNEANYVQDIHYNEKGQRKDIWYGNGIKTSYIYDTKTFRLRRLLTVKLISNEILQDLNYRYDPIGNITELQDDAQQTLFFNNAVIAPIQKFVYDALYRLIEANGRELISNADFGAEDNWNDAAWQTTHKGDGSAVQNYTQKYTYDEVGNILELQHIAGTGSYTRSYVIDTNSNKLMSTDVGSNAYSYSHDERGNITKMPHLDSMAWNTQNELKSISKGSEPTYYQYSGGERTRKFTDKGAIREERIHLDSYEIYRKYVNNVLDIERTIVHVSDDNGRIATLEVRTIGTDPSPEELTRYIYSNHLQSASLELDEIGAIISYEEYHPYGTTSYQAMNATINAAAKRYRYTGKERDEESGLYYHGARYYVPWLAIWSAVDPLENKYVGMSPYNYCVNNPIKYWDDDGREIIDSKGNIAAKFEDGKVIFTEFATPDIQEAIQALNINDVGKETIKDLIKDLTKVEIELNKTDVFQNIAEFMASEKGIHVSESNNQNTTLLLGATKVLESSESELLRTKVIIFTKAIEKAIELKEPKMFEGGLKIYYEYFTSEEILGAVMAHEVLHAIDEKSSSRFVTSGTEDSPNQNEEKFYRVLNNEKNENRNESLIPNH